MCVPLLFFGGDHRSSDPSMIVKDHDELQVSSRARIQQDCS